MVIEPAKEDAELGPQAVDATVEPASCLLPAQPVRDRTISGCDIALCIIFHPSASAKPTACANLKPSPPVSPLPAAREHCTATSAGFPDWAIMRLRTHAARRRKTQDVENVRAGFVNALGRATSACRPVRLPNQEACDSDCSCRFPR
jgi:hypothetical protein